MGSFLQLLFHDKAFRQDLMQTQLDARHKMKMIEGMQKLFALLRYSQVRAHVAPTQVKL